MFWQLHLYKKIRRHYPKPKPFATEVAMQGKRKLLALDGKPIFWRTHVSPPGDRVAMRIGDWKLVGNDTLTKFQGCRESP